MTMKNNREHPITILFRSFKAIKNIIWGMIPLFVLVLKGKTGEYGYLAIVGAILLVAILCTLQWYFLTYRIEKNGLYVKHGVFVKKETFVTAERVQSVSTNASLFHQIFDLESVIVETAGGTEPEIDLYGVPKHVAETIVATLKDRAELKNEEQQEQQEQVEEDTKSYHLTTKEMLLAGATSGKIGVLFAGLMVVWNEVNDWIPDSWMKTMSSQFENLSYIAWGGVVLVFLLVSWVFATFHFMLKHFGFHIIANGKKLKMSSGLLERRNVTLPQKRIQGITIEEGIIRSLFGYASIKAEAVVSMKDSKVHEITLHPFIHKKDIPVFLEKLLPQYVLEEHIEPVPKRSWSRFIWKKALFTLLIAGSLTFWKPFLFPSFLLVGIALWYGHACYKAAGFSIRDAQLTLTRRFIAKQTTIMKRKHIQSIGTEQNPFQKRDKIGNIRTHLLSGISGIRVKVKHLDEEQNNRILSWFHARKQKGHM